MKKLVWLFLGLCTINLFAAEKAPKILTVTTESTLQTNGRGAGSSNNVASVSHEIYFDFALPQEFVFQVYTGGEKPIEGPSTSGTWNDSYLQLEKALFKGDVLTFSLSGQYIVPLSEESRDIAHKTWGMQIRPTFLFMLYKDGDMKFTYRTRPIWNEFFYSQDIDDNGYYNIERSFAWTNRFSFHPNSWLYLQAFFNYTTNWNSNDEQVNDSWKLMQLIGFVLNENIYIEAAHSTGSKLYNAEGRRVDVDVFDSKSSTYTLCLGFTF